MTEPRMQLEDWLDDLCVRFIINLPQEDLSSVARICFQVEEAQWFYEDFIRPLDPSLPSMSLRSFCLRIFQHCPLLSVFSNGDHMRAFEEFLAYKTRVPVRGAIMLNHAMDSVVLVKGWKKGANWSFPRGKINKDEDDLDCAVREVYEETGYDIKAAGLVPEDEEVKYIEITMREQHMRLYVFRDVPMDTHFEPRTRKEISKIEWYRLSELPAFRKKGQQQVQDGTEAAMNANKFYMVAPFLVPLKKWVLQQKKKDVQRAANSQFLAAPVTADALTEEEAGTDRNTYLTQSESEHRSNVTPGLDTLEGATAALHRLLKIQPPTQGLQPLSAAQSPAAKNSGDALLALLQGNSDAKFTGNTRYVAPLPNTSLDHTIISGPVPRTLHHQHHSRHPDMSLSTMPPPPSFPLQQKQGSNLYQSPHQQFKQHHEGHSILQNPEIPHFPHPLPQYFAQHSEQVQQLQHPQPLPPQVLRTIFTGGLPHVPPNSQSFNQQSDMQHFHNGTQTGQNAQLPNIPMPFDPSSTTLAPPRLTSHSLALLNAFKSQDHATAVADSPSDIQLRQFTAADDVSAIHPEFLPHRHYPAEMSGDDIATHPAQEPSTRLPPGAEHRSSLLNMFKTTANTAALAKGEATKLEPAPLVEKVDHSSASSHLSPTTGLLKRQHGDSTKHHSRAPKTGSPFRPLAIMTRPQLNAATSPSSASLETPKGGPNGRSRLLWSPKREQASLKLDDSPPKSFQPQILKRPQPPDKSLIPELAAPSPPALDSLPSQLSTNRGVPLAEHRQTLLSLFGRGPTTESPILIDSSKSALGNDRSFEPASIAARSRVGSLVSAGGDLGTSVRRGSQTPTSPADKAFLLGYLDDITRNIGR